jgi:hypothetical protein
VRFGDQGLKLATSGVIEEILADSLNMTGGKVHAYTKSLQAAGLIAKSGHGPRSGHRWSSEEAAYALTALTSGASLSTLPQDVLEFCALPVLPRFDTKQYVEMFGPCTFLAGQTFGQCLVGLIDDHRAGHFARWRERGAIALGINIQFAGRVAGVIVDGMRGAKGAHFGRTFAHEAPPVRRVFRVTRDLLTSINRPDCLPTLFEQLADALNET